MGASNRIAVAQSLPHRPAEKRRQRGAHAIARRAAACCCDTGHYAGNRAAIDLGKLQPVQRLAVLQQMAFDFGVRPSPQVSALIG